MTLGVLTGWIATDRFSDSDSISLAEDFGSRSQSVLHQL